MFINRLKNVLATSGERVAVRAGCGVLTYAELNRHASTLARGLGDREIGAGKLVAVYGPRGPALITGMIGTMLAGAAYTVVEAAGSVEEEARRLEQIAPDLILVAGDPGPLVVPPGIPWRPMENVSGEETEAPLLPDVPDEAPAYVLYTSGSTGTPKGVAVTHANLAHYCDGLASRLELAQGMTFAHVSTLSADLGNTCLFLSLQTAGTLYLADEFERRDPAALASALVSHRVDVLKITPTHWRSILAACAQRMAGSAPLRWLILGGERLQAGLARATLDSRVTERLLNHYGPTETTIGATVHRVAAVELGQDSEPVPIGRPFGQTTLHVLDSDGRFRSADVQGELYISGPGVAQGYWKRPDLTSERFVSPAGVPGRCYRTGDRVHIDHSGLVTFLGRVDRQVKVNGYRVELEHVEHAIQQLSGVELAAVVHHAQNGRDYLLCAHSGVERDGAALRARLLQQLPAHMVPAVFQHYGKLPSNPNGKLDMTAVRSSLAGLLQAEPASPQHGPDSPADVRLQPRLLDIFRRLTGSSTVAVDDSFFDLGADSLDAIQLVSELQLAGFPVTARGFLACPTVRGVLTMIQGHPAPQAVTQSEAAESASRCPCSPAQAWFFAQRFPEPNRWTQSMLLELGTSLDPAVLGSVVEQVIGEQPSLRLRFVHDAASDTWFFEPCGSGHALSVHTCAAAPADALEALVQSRYRHLESTLDIHEGKVFAAELLIAGAQQYLMLVAHHLVVDVISWRVLLDELMRRYAIAMGSEPEVPAARPAAFGAWTADLSRRRPQFAPDLQHWPARVSAAVPPGAGVEGDAQTGWLVLSPAETAIVTQAAATLATSVDHLLLARFLEQCAQTWPEDTLRVRVESHGRLNLSDDIDVSRTIGWFTSAFPVDVASRQTRTPQFAHQLHLRLRSIPNLGHAWGLHHPDDHAEPYCFNFLGHSRLGLRNDWHVRPASVALPGLRGTQNDRVHRLKLTARLLDGVLILDLNFDPTACPPAAITTFLAGLRQRLAGWIEPSGSHKPAGLLTLPSSSSGALWNIPAEVMALRADAARRRPYTNVLITGTTGFIGIHVLRELLLNTHAHLYCVVREVSGIPAVTRLHEAWTAFFGRGELESQMHRITVLRGDITQPALGIGQEVWDRVAMTTDAIYHLAADTRLVGSRRDMEAAILRPTVEILRLTSEGKDKDLHFMSTLAVSGAHEAGNPAVFDEDSLDIGQTFLNEYERAKFEAESLARDFAYQGHSIFIYRSGNVTGDSRTGLFQRNAAANRWVQCLRAIARSGHAPRTYRESIVLSPVDIVARGIVMLSLNRELTGGTFHVDADRGVPAGQFVSALEDLGLPVQHVETERLDEALKVSGRLDDHDVAIGYFWASRDARNVHYDNARTLALLARDGVRFPSITHEWIQLFVSRLYHSGILGPSRPDRSEAATAPVESETH